jgi:predicted nucleic acid-binding protein
MRALFDTNIIIDYLRGILKAKTELSKYDSKAISIITKIEILSGITNQEVEIQVKKFLDSFEIYPVTEEISEIAVDLRRQKVLKIPDAIIWATAKANNLLLVTRDSKDFPANLPEIRVPYKLK